MMHEAGNWIKWGFGAIGAALSWIFGPWDSLLGVLVAMVALDYITGVICAATHGELSSQEGFRGLAKKIGIFAMVALAGLMERVVPAMGGALRSAACMFYIANEGISIMENWGGLGLPLPEALKGALRQFQKGSEQKEE